MKLTEQRNNSWYWIPLKSGVSLMLMLLLPQHAYAGGVCVTCPPGHTCPYGELPILGGSSGQILRRTIEGTEWTNVAALQGPQGAIGAVGPQGAVGAAGPVGPQGVAGVTPPSCPAISTMTSANVQHFGGTSAILPLGQIVNGTAMVGQTQSGSTTGTNPVNASAAACFCRFISGSGGCVSAWVAIATTGFGCPVNCSDNVATWRRYAFWQ